MSTTPDHWRSAPTSRARIDDSRQGMAYNVKATPDVVIDAKVVHAGGVAA